MHDFVDLVEQCVASTLDTLREANEQTIDALQTSGATSLVKTLQSIQLQKAILAVGIFSLFEAALQDRLNCRNGFLEAQRILQEAEEVDLEEAFSDLYLAINVLKHGRGRSYDELVGRSEVGLPFHVRLPDADFFNEGDVAELIFFIQVDDSFVQYCADVIRQVDEVVQKHRPELV